jgi:hypothetical protein
MICYYFVFHQQSPYFIIDNGATFAILSKISLLRLISKIFKPKISPPILLFLLC